ncbi:uncharacterized protein LY89DRAFT_742198 [Mollisia scopiformis]|uniref:Nuclear GTPase SLIP-GC n=1 Tax=Mollisia scopiformis TaxID=149040 RepID=A0A132B7Y7_MOLSC|nr:uncharacterized protein LY89DRAFT_742198 [Mollisia scopiformis]KUJ08363.1 hypothetical protein LY89DRAFT_742198 [Mollisia scopiformis]
MSSEASPEPDFPYMDDHESEHDKDENMTKNAGDSLIPNPDWRSCENVGRLKRVLIKEQANRKAHSAMVNLRKTLHEHVLQNPSCQSRIEKIDLILNRKKEHQILVGFLGATGVGKSTLINALVGYENLIPTNSYRACTAVVVELSHNKSNDPAELFRAEVEQHAVGDEDDGAEEENRDLIQQTFDKVKVVYPRIRSLESLRSNYSVEKLLNDPDVRHILGSKQAIKSPTKTKLAEEIKNHIDSGNGGDDASNYWPLVKFVKVFAKSEFLMHGITLVDLPGNMDNNAARSAIAAQYQSRLSVTCVLAECKRAMSDRNAHDLLAKVTKCDLQLDGLYNSESLCFVVTQNDQKFDVDHYMKEYPELKKKCADESENWKTFNSRFNEVSKEEKAAVVRENANKTEAKALIARIKRIRQILGLPPKGYSTSSQNRKRAAGETNDVSNSSIATDEQLTLRHELSQKEKELSEVQAKIEKGTKNLLSISRRLAGIENSTFHVRSRIRAACIKNRNDVATAAIQKDYQATLRQIEKESTGPLKVFCVASKIYLAYKKSKDPNKKYSGFPNIGETQIGALRDWLVGTTFDTRDKYAQAFLEDVETFLDSVGPWLKDKYSDLKMTAELRELWEHQMDEQLQELEQKFSELSLNIGNSMKEVVKSKIYSAVPEAEKSAAGRALNTVGTWGGQLHWSTHKAVNRERGEWTDSKQRTHTWNKDLVRNFTTPLLPQWHKTFFEEFPIKKELYVMGADRFIASFAESSADRNMCPDVSDGLDVLEDHILRTQNLLRAQLDQRFQEIEKVVKKSHRYAAPAVKDFLEPMYAQCAGEGGKGHFQRNQTTHRTSMIQDGILMYREGFNAVKAALDEMLDGLPASFAVDYNVALTQIREEVNLFFEQNSANGSRTSSRKVVSLTKTRLHDEFMAHVHRLAADWISEVAASYQPEDDSDDDMGYDDGDFFDTSRNDGQDEDYEDIDEEDDEP